MAGETPEIDETTPKIDETKGLATVGMALGIGILTRLEAKGLLAAHDVDEVLEGILNSLEDFLPPTDPGPRSARALVDAIAGIVAFRRTQSRPPR
jgi:hypothetical protein